MNKFSKAVCKVIVTALVALPLITAASLSHAAGEVATITALTSFGCAEYGTNFDWTMNGEPATEYRINMVVEANGQTVMNEDVNTFTGSSSSNYAAYFSDSYGPATDNWPLPPNTIMEISMIMRLESDQSIAATGTMSLNCTTGDITSWIPQPAATSVPVMPLWLLGFMGGILSLLGMWKLRKA